MKDWVWGKTEEGFADVCGVSVWPAQSTSGFSGKTSEFHADQLCKEDPVNVKLLLSRGSSMT